MKNVLFAALFCWVIAGGTGAYGQQVQLLEIEPGDAAPGAATADSGAAPQIILPAPSGAEAPKAAVTASTAPAAGEKKTIKPAAKKKSPEKAAAVSVSTAPARPAAAKPVAAPAVSPKPVEVVEFAPIFEMQPAAPPAAAVPAKAATPKAALAAASSSSAAAAKIIAPPAAAKPVVLAVKPDAPDAPAAKPVVAAFVSAASGGFSVGKKHKVSGGDTLWDLSGKYYKDPYKWGKIYNANLDTVTNPDRIYPKEELVIPDITEEVAPARKAPAVISGADTVREGGLSVSEVQQVEAARVAAAAATAAAAQQVLTIKAGAMSDDLNASERNDLSTEMPEDQKEWSSFTKVVQDSWTEDGVIDLKEKVNGDTVDDGLSFIGETVVVRLSGPVQVKKGDFFTVYLRGAAAYDKDGRRIGRELQPAGMLEVISVDDAVVKARVVDASTAIRKGLVVKLSVRS